MLFVEFDETSLEKARELYRKTKNTQEYNADIPAASHNWVENPLNPFFAAHWFLQGEGAPFEAIWRCFFRPDVGYCRDEVDPLIECAKTLTPLLKGKQKAGKDTFRNCNQAFAKMVVMGKRNAEQGNYTLCCLNGESFRATYADAKRLLIVGKLVDREDFVSRDADFEK